MSPLVATTSIWCENTRWVASHTLCNGVLTLHLRRTTHSQVVQIHADGSLSSIGRQQWGVRPRDRVVLAAPQQQGQVACGFDRTFAILRSRT
jgi:hypothetical protein